LASSATAAECTGASGLPSQVSSATLEEATLCLMNDERAKRGLKPLRRSSKLERAAHKHTLDMLRSNLFSHTGSNGSTPEDRIRRAGYLKGTRDWLVGENIAYGEDQLGAPKQIVAGWMDSAPHRRNILGKRFRDVGISVEHGAPGASGSRSTTYTTDFGRRT
jgi:uncharacterized protein YkwD